MYICGFMDKIRFFQNDLKTTTYAEILIFTKLVTKIYFFLNDLKKRALPRNVDIYGYMDKDDF